MGHRVVEQTQAAVAALLDGDMTQAYRVLDREPQIDYLSLDADEEIFQVIARRQPTAVDLRIVLALSRIAGDVERAGDKAVRIARQSLGLRDSGIQGTLPLDELKDLLRRLDDQACCMFERSIEAVAGFDVELALGVFEDEPLLFETSADARACLGREDLAGFTAAPDRLPPDLRPCARAHRQPCLQYRRAGHLCGRGQGYPLPQSRDPDRDAASQPPSLSASAVGALAFRSAIHWTPK
jgi:hypothetical protein